MLSKMTIIRFSYESLSVFAQCQRENSCKIKLDITNKKEHLSHYIARKILLVRVISLELILSILAPFHEQVI